MGRFFLALLAILLASPAIPCGNKFLVWGRTLQNGGPAGPQMARVLLFRNDAAPYTRNTTAEPGLRAMLKAFGLKVDTADDPNKLDRALRKNHYEIVIADFADAGPVSLKVRAGGSDAVVLPVMRDPASTEAAVAVEQYQGLLALPAEPDEVIEAIAGAVERTGRRISSD